MKPVSLLEGRRIVNELVNGPSPLDWQLGFVQLARNLRYITQAEWMTLADSLRTRLKQKPVKEKKILIVPGADLRDEP